ncbi:MAG: molybdenum cofactor guanylyltransferase [Desulfuromonadaceae bacterium]
MNNQFSNITGVILVGGKSRRMGQDKALLPVAGIPIVKRLIDCLQGCFQHLLLVGDQPERFEQYQLPIVPDIYPGSSLGGLYTGLKSVTTEHVFVTSCDIPFPNPELIRLICRQANSYDAVIPATKNGLEPLFARYRQSALPATQAALETGNYRITSVLEQLQILRIESDALHAVDPDGRALLNINTPHEYAACPR